MFVFCRLTTLFRLDFLDDLFCGQVFEHFTSMVFPLPFNFLDVAYLLGFAFPLALEQFAEPFE